MKPRALLVWSRRAALALLALAALAAAALALLILRVEATLPATSALGRSYQPPQVTRVLARDGSLLAEVFTERRTVVAIDAVPPAVKLAVLAAEDASFYEHEGLDYLGMLRAFAKNLRSGRTRQGGSTITQQVVKNILVGPERTYARKLREVVLARKIEQELSKDQILELYLNHIYFGHGRYGVEEAARFYFGKPVGQVTLAEAALLAGLPKGPELYSPRHDRRRAEERRGFVLDQMEQKGFARGEEVRAARAEPIALAPALETAPQLAPEVVDAVRRTLRQVAGEAAQRGGFTVHTTIDPALQAAARAAVRQNLHDYDRRHGLVAPLRAAPPGRRRAPRPFEGTPRSDEHRVYLGVVTAANDAAGTLEVQVGTLRGEVKLANFPRYNPKGLPPSQFAEPGRLVRVSVLSPEGATRRAELRLELGPQSALVALDVRSREVLALVGSYEAIAGGLDRATFARRQPGSAFKPLVYSYALHARLVTPATQLLTSPDSLPGYRPKNYERAQGEAPVLLREAVAQSVNVSAVHVLNLAGAANVVAWARALGIESPLRPEMSLALGAHEVKPVELAAAFATFAAGGMHLSPVLVTRIVGPDGRELTPPPRPPGRRVLEEAEAYLATSVLRSVVERGTAKRARALGRPVAGKTGTSNQAKDAWFVGYSTDVACAVWTGFDDAVPLGPGEAGAATALPAFVSFMKEAHRKRPVTDFPVPPGLLRLAIDPATGLRAYDGQADAVEELFLAGTEPIEVATPDAGDGEAGAAPTSEDAGGPPTLAARVPGGEEGGGETDPPATARPGGEEGEGDGEPRDPGALPALPSPEEPPPF